MNSLKTLTGAIICGGKSSRMGSDKALLQKKGVPWAEICRRLLETTCREVVFSVNSGQYATFPSIFPQVGLVQDTLDVEGPLAALFSLHLAKPGADFFLIACDMTDVSPATIERLVNIYLKKKEEEVFVYKNGEEYEPLLGIYTSEALAKGLLLWQNGALPRQSMKNLLAHLKISSPIADGATMKELKNYNYPSDIEN